MTRRDEWIAHQVSGGLHFTDNGLARLLRDAMAVADAEWCKKLKEMAELNRRAGNYERAAALFNMLDEMNATRQENGAGGNAVLDRVSPSTALQASDAPAYTDDQMIDRCRKTLLKLNLPTEAMNALSILTHRAARTLPTAPLDLSLREAAQEFADHFDSIPMATQVADSWHKLKAALAAQPTVLVDVIMKNDDADENTVLFVGDGASITIEYKDELILPDTVRVVVLEEK